MLSFIQSLRQATTFCGTCILLLCTLHIAGAQNVPFSKGVNLTNWFQTSNARQIQFTKYTKTDFEQIQSLGCDVIRLPINLHFMTNGAPEYILDPLFLTFLDGAVDWAEELNMHLILDNHTFDPAVNTDPAVEDVLVKVWKQMAAHFKNRSTNIYYEVLNEPHGISDQIWGAIQQNVIDSIRTIDQKHTIIVGPADWNSFRNLAQMPVYSDTNLIYTFHFYDPFVFTHQGATWTSPSLGPLADVPFPYHPDSMPTFPASLNGTWIQSNFNNYANDGNVQAVEDLVDIATQFRQSRNVPIFCGEFGVYIPNSQNDDRVTYYQALTSYLNAQNIAWTSWDYEGGFGLYEEGGSGLFDHDLNIPLLAAMGLNTPPQSEFVVTPDTAGFFIYSDFIENRIFEASQGTGILDFYGEINPNYGDFNILWSNASRYNSIGFDFRPIRDFSYLLTNGFAIDLFIRGNNPTTQLDIRFLDTKTTDPNDHPWRMRTTISSSNVNWNNTWQHLHIPLSQFTEHGSWDNGMWYTPVGDFDWQAIDRFEIVAEYSDLSQTDIWFDHIQLTELDTALVNDSAAVSIADELSRISRVHIFPNPSSDRVYFGTELQHTIEYKIINLLGKTISEGKFREKTELDIADWPIGMYYVRFYERDTPLRSRRIWKR